MRMIDDDEYEEIVGFPVIVRSLGEFYEINIEGAFEHPRQVANAVRVLSNCNEQDIVQINLNSPGGALHAVAPLLHGMAKCQGTIRVIATGIVASAATLVLLEADEFEIAAITSIMFHEASYGSAGKVHDVKSETQHTEALCTKVMREAYAGFFDAKEMEELLNGKTFYMMPEEFVDRFEKRSIYLNEQAELLQMEVQEKIQEALDNRQEQE